jgi:type IV pilus assembly protein PilN
MIKINLFPFRAARIKENIRRQVTVYLLSVIFLIAVMSYYFLDLNSRVKSLRNDHDAKEKELASFKDTNIRLAKLKKTRAEGEVKLETIKTLEKGKTGPVKLLDDIATSVPRDKLWLTTLKEEKGTLTLEGTAMDNETVADFMNRLESTESLISVELVRTKQKKVKELNLSLKDFALNCKTYAYKEKPPPEPEKKKGGRKKGRK